MIRKIIILLDIFSQFQGILKPGYNVVDMLEVELINDKRAPRDFNADLINVNIGFKISNNNLKYLNSIFNEFSSSEMKFWNSGMEADGWKLNTTMKIW